MRNLPFLMLVLILFFVLTPAWAGHFENGFTQTLLERFISEQKPRIIPEYKPSAYVVVTEVLVNPAYKETYIPLLRGIIEKRVQIVVMATDKNKILAALAKDFTREEMSSFLVMTTTAAVKSQWARDVFGVFATGANGLVLLDQNRRDKDLDRMGMSLIQALGDQSQLPAILYSSLPVYDEGGNIQCLENGVATECYLNKTKNILANSDKIVDEDIPYSVKEIKVLYAKAMNATVTFLDSGYESTGHIDTWLKAIGPLRVLIAQLTQATIKEAEKRMEEVLKQIESDTELTPEEKTRILDNTKDLQAAAAKYLLALQRDLGDRASFFKSRGYQVFPVPLPIPLADVVIASLFERRPPNAHNTPYFPTYLNSLLLNDGVKIIAFIPKYTYPFFNNEENDYPYPDHALIPEYQRQTEQAYRDAGVSEIRWIPSDRPLREGGGIHCLTNQIPFWEISGSTDFPLFDQWSFPNQSSWQ